MPNSPTKPQSKPETETNNRSQLRWKERSRTINGDMITNETCGQNSPQG